MYRNFEMYIAHDPLRFVLSIYAIISAARDCHFQVRVTSICVLNSEENPSISERQTLSSFVVQEYAVFTDAYPWDGYHMARVDKLFVFTECLDSH